LFSLSVPVLSLAPTETESRSFGSAEVRFAQDDSAFFDMSIVSSGYER